MTLEPLYRITFSYGEAYRAGAHTLLFAEGACAGRLAGRFRGANRARLSSTGAWIPQLEGAVVTEDGATILIELTGRGRPDADPVGRVTGMDAQDRRRALRVAERHRRRRRRRGLPGRASRPGRVRAALEAAP